MAHLYDWIVTGSRAMLRRSRNSGRFSRHMLRKDCWQRLMPNDIERPPRSVISLTQIHTFLTLVEDGSVARASRRLGVGHSTVSAHSKLVAEEIGRHQFS